MSPIFEALADPTRQRILATLLSGERAVSELADVLGVAQPSVSKHLAKLKAVGLVAQRADAQKRHYSLTPEPLIGLDRWLAPYRRQLRRSPPLQMAEIERSATGITLRFDLYITAPRQRIWAALSECPITRDWLGATTIEPRIDGRYKVRFIEGDIVMSSRIVRWEPTRALMYRWRSGPDEQLDPITYISFDLEETGAATRVRFTHSNLLTPTAGKMAPVWHAHLDRLIALIDGSGNAPPAGHFEQLKARYMEQFAATRPGSDRSGRGSLAGDRALA